jgi:hypothetical protein
MLGMDKLRSNGRISRLRISFSLRDLEKMDVADPLFPNKVNEAYQKFKVINLCRAVYTIFNVLFLDPHH